MCMCYHQSERRFSSVFLTCVFIFSLLQISKAEFDLVQAVQENANLRSLIVQSPDKLQVYFLFRLAREKDFVYRTLVF